MLGHQRDEAALQARIKALEAERRDEVMRLSAELENAELRASHLQEQHASSQERAESLKEELERARLDIACQKEGLKQQHDTLQKKVMLMEEEVEGLRAAEREREKEATKLERERERERAEMGQAGDLKVRALEAKCEDLESGLALLKKEKEQWKERERESEEAKAVLKEDCAKLRESALANERERERERERMALELQKERARASCAVERERAQWKEQLETFRVEAGRAKQVGDDEAAHAREKASQDREGDWGQALEAGRQRLCEADAQLRNVRAELQTCKQDKDAALRALDERSSECAEVKQRLSVLEAKLMAADMRQERTENMAQDLVGAARLCLTDALGLELLPPCSGHHDRPVSAYEGWCMG